jgi:hypothetical protein
MLRSPILPFRSITCLLLILATLLLSGTPPAVAQTGADLEAEISGRHTVRYGGLITYTITAINVGDENATGVMIEIWVPDWFNRVDIDCLTGTYDGGSFCVYPDLTPGERASMLLTLRLMGPEPHMFQDGNVYASNDVNLTNNIDSIKVVMTGPRPKS